MKIIIEDVSFKGKHYDRIEIDSDNIDENSSEKDITNEIVNKLYGGEYLSKEKGA